MMPGVPRTLLFFLLAPLAAAAEPPASPPAAPLSLEEAVRAALDHFPTVQARRAEIDGAEAEFSRARSAWFPNLSLNVTANRYQKPSLVSPIHGFDPQTLPEFDRTGLQGAAFLDYTLFDGAARGSRVSEARERVDAARAARDGTASSLVAETAARYLEALSRKEALAAHDARLTALRAEQDRVKQFEAAGRAARVERLRVEAALAGAEAERVRLAARLGESERDLAELTGLAPDHVRAANLTPLAAADPSIDPPRDLVAAALEANPGVREAQGNAAAARASASAARGARLPRLELTGTYQVWSSPGTSPAGEWNAALKLTQVLFTGGEVAGGIRRTAAGSRQADEGLRLARINVRRSVLDAVDRTREADARVVGLEAAVERYREVARIEQLALEAGTGTQTDFLNAEADLLDARADLADAHRASLTARVELARLTGVLDPAWLSEHLETKQ